LLNVGPTADREIPEPSVQVLNKVGAWLRRNKKSIYEAQASPVDTCPCDPYKYTLKLGKLYVHILAWPWNGKIEIQGVKNEVEKAYFLAVKRNLRFKQKEERVLLHLGSKPLDPVDNVIVLEMKNKSGHSVELT